jgi:hypothetical protein
VGYRDYCGTCGESYDSDNLMTCSRCNRDFCYRCGDWGEPLCTDCLTDRTAAGSPAPAPTDEPKESG